jgi:hypothetical protein
VVWEAGHETVFALYVSDPEDKTKFLVDLVEEILKLSLVDKDRWGLGIGIVNVVSTLSWGCVSECRWEGEFQSWDERNLQVPLTLPEFALVKERSSDALWVALVAELVGIFR